MPSSEKTKSRETTTAAAAYGSTTVIAETPDHAKVKLQLNNLRLFSSGVFSNVYRGKIVNATSTDPESVAVKKCWTKSQSSLTEARIFGRLHHHRHKNVVHLLYMFENGHDDLTCYGLVFEFMPSNLYTYIREMRKVTQKKPDLVEVKLFAWQLFRGQAHLANQKIIHRDIKPQNILVNPDTGILKIGDFGSSKFYDAAETSHSYHVTRYYRAPELILKSNTYGPEIDVWSCGCVLGEMLRCTTLWVGTSTEHQLHLIAETLGIPSSDDIRAMKGRELEALYSSKIQPFYAKASTSVASNFRKILPHAPPEAINLMVEVLKYKPMERAAGPKVLGNKFFKELFDSATKRTVNGKAILNNILTMEDLKMAIEGDRSPEDAEGPSKTGSQSKNDDDEANCENNTTFDNNNDL